MLGSAAIRALRSASAAVDDAQHRSLVASPETHGRAVPFLIRLDVTHDVTLLPELRSKPLELLRLGGRPPRAERVETATPATSLRAPVGAVDQLIFGTGYRPNLAKLEFIDADLRRQVGHTGGEPSLDHGFESTVPGLHFVGVMAGYAFGPLCRFVAGAGVAAKRISARVCAS